jgi:hypothetical protein
LSLFIIYYISSLTGSKSRKKTHQNWTAAQDIVAIVVGAMVVGHFTTGNLPTTVCDLCRSVGRSDTRIVRSRAGQLSSQAKEEKFSLGDRSEFTREQLLFAMDLMAKQPRSFFFCIEEGHLPNLVMMIKDGMPAPTVEALLV